MAFTAYELAVLARADGVRTRPRRKPRIPGFLRESPKRRRLGRHTPRSTNV